MKNIKCNSCKYETIFTLLSLPFIKSASENPVLWTGMKDASAEGRKKRPDAETILSQAQHKVHDEMVWFWSYCHPEPGPELDSGSIEFGISVLNFGF
jgi:hypothetical protein